MHKSLPGEFEAINARLKHEFSLKKDAKVANLLGLTPQAFYSRKKDNSFPKDRLSLFLKNHAEEYSYIDFRYILTGESENEATGKEVANAYAWNELSEMLHADFLEKLVQLPHYLQEQFLKMSREYLNLLISLNKKIKSLE